MSPKEEGGGRVRTTSPHLEHQRWKRRGEVLARAPPLEQKVEGRGRILTGSLPWTRLEGERGVSQGRSWVVQRWRRMRGIGGTRVLKKVEERKGAARKKIFI